MSLWPCGWAWASRRRLFYAVIMTSPLFMLLAVGAPLMSANGRKGTIFVAFREYSATPEQTTGLAVNPQTQGHEAKPGPPRFHVPWCDNCFIRNYTYLHEPLDTCKPKEPSASSTLEVVFLSLSKPGDFEVRSIIRRTWGSRTLNNTSKKTRLVFLLGTTSDSRVEAGIQREALLHGDIVQQNFPDAYSNLTLKTLMGLEWASRHCSNAKYAMKVDDDVYVNVRRIIKLVRAQKVRTRLIGRCIMKQHSPRRRGGWKWRVPWGQYNQSRYPIYCNGPSYLVPLGVAGAIIKTSPNIPFIKLEDVYVGICLRATGYDVRHRRDYTARIRLSRDRQAASVDCETIYGIMTTHHTDPHTMLNVWHKCFNEGGTDP